MIRFRGNLYTGADSRSRPVILQVDEHRQLLVIDGDASHSGSYSLSEISISSRLGNTPRWLWLEDDLRIETQDNDTVDLILEQVGVGHRLWLHRLESHWPYLLLFLLLVAGSTWGFGVYGLPAMAKRVAFALPPEISRELGQQTLESLDQLVFRPSTLDSKRRQQLQRRFAHMLQQLDRTEGAAAPYRLLFRSSPTLGANAFALPSGTLIITDALVQLAESDLELVAVLAHEIGHVEHRHALRRAIQSSVLPLIIISITGDVGSATTLVATLPTLAMEASYSQNFEREADQFARNYLQQHNISEIHFINLLNKLEQAHPGDMPSLFSSHPATRERIQALKAERASSSAL